MSRTGSFLPARTPGSGPAGCAAVPGRSWIRIGRLLASLFPALGVLAALDASPVRAQSATEGLSPCPPALSDALKGVPFDPRPRELSANSHFVVSDEKSHWLFHDAAANRGGALLGVGTDQNYLMAGWARPEILILLDFDQVVVDVHAVYREVFLHSPDARSFLAAWGRNQAVVVEGWIAEAIPDEASQKRVLKAFRLARNLVEWRLVGLVKAYRAAGVKTFLDDPEQYRYLVELFKAGRVFAIRGDLTGTQAVRGVGKALADAGVPLRVLYLSNAEKYFEFTADYKANMRSLPFDDRTVVLRTGGGWHGGPPSPDGLYTYVVQPGANFHAWMQDGVAVSFPALMVRRKNSRQVPGLATLDKLPPAPKGASKPKGKK